MSVDAGATTISDPVSEKERDDALRAAHIRDTTNNAPEPLDLDDDALALTPLQWLLQHGDRHQTGRSLLNHLAAVLQHHGFPLLRASLFMPTLHPQTSGNTIIWWRDRPGPQELSVLRGMEDTPAFKKSPLPVILNGAAAIRARLDLDDVALEYPILEDLKAVGATDYVAMPVVFHTGEINFATWVTDRPGGFTSAELATLYELLPALSLRIEVIERHRLTGQLMEIYLGRNAGRRVLAGDIVRGVGETIQAVIWFSDLRGFTAMTDQLPTDEVIALLDDYFECMALPVEERGGEVLKFIGDGLLAIFPQAKSGSCDAPARALKAALEAGTLMRHLNTRRAKAGRAALRHAVGLHVGAVSYGNIGSPDRLDFTVIGPAVNLANRLQGLSKVTGQSIIASAAFAGLCPEPMDRIGRFPVAGLDDPVEVFTAPDAA